MENGFCEADSSVPNLKVKVSSNTESMVLSKVIILRPAMEIQRAVFVGQAIHARTGQDARMKRRGKQAHSWKMSCLQICAGSVVGIYELPHDAGIYIARWC